MELDEFLESYFAELARAAAAYGFEAGPFSQAVSTSVRAMTRHDASVLNADAFWASLDACLGGTGPAERAFFDEFYRDGFGRLGDAVVPDPAAARAVETLRMKGYPLYLTTMPLFPRAAVEWRLRWAGIDPAAFNRMTCYDNSTSTKPHLDYYRQNLSIAGVPASSVLMVGNDTRDDLACLDVGMDAYLVTDYLLNSNGFDVEAVRHGSMADFAAFVDGLPVCSNRHAAEGDTDRPPVLSPAFVSSGCVAADAASVEE
jgi:FMN phosphatase YigB (HAD superfamily)